MKLSLQEPGFVLSGTAHVALLLSVLIGFSSAKPFDDATEAVAVDVISESQFNEITKGDKQVKVIVPNATLRVDRVSPVEEQKDPGEAKKDTPTPPPPPLRPTVKVAQEDVNQEKPAPAPPVPKAPPLPKPEVKPVKATPVKEEKEDDEEDEKDAEVIKKAKVEPPKPVKEEPKVDPVAKMLEQQKLEEQKKAEEAKKRLEDEKKKAAEAARKLADAKKAEDERKSKEKAESDRLQASIRNKLLLSRDAPASSGSTGAAVSRVASAGLATATGQKLSPSDRSQLMGLLQEQMQKCWSPTTTQSPQVKPLVRMQLAKDGTLSAHPVLTNSSSDPVFAATADSGMRALRQCAPYRIPAKFNDMYEDWKTVTVRLDPSDLL